MKRFFPWLLVTLLLVLFLMTACGDDDDDDSSSAEPDDDDTTIADDDNDDSSPPADDDDNDNDDNNDDDATADPYTGMAPAGRTIDEMLAIASHMSTGAEYDRDREFEIQQEVVAGISLVRRGFYWNNIEPENDAWDFSGYDVMVPLIRNAGMQPVAMLTRGVDWAMPNGSPSDIDPAYFADFTGTTAARYADEVDFYEIWNEQNTSRFWDPEPDPEHYGELLKAAYTAIHANDPTATVMFGGMSSLDDKNLFDERGIWSFLARVGEYHPDLCDYLDGLAMHPYTFLQQPGPEIHFDLGFYGYPDLRGNVAEVRAMLDDLGCPDIPIHLTEMGWPSLLIGNERQAAYYSRGVLLASSVGVAGFYWYTFYDEYPDSTIPTEDYFGLYKLPDGVTDPDPKPSFLALLGLHAVVGESRFAGDLGTALGWGEDDYALAFADDHGLWTIALWHADLQLDDGATVTVPLHPASNGAWALLDQEGNQTSSGIAEAGGVEVAISGRVVYLQFNLESSNSY